MSWKNIKQTPCSIARTLSIVGDRWTLLIIRDCFLKTRRFDDFQKQLGVTRHVLVERLNKLVLEGILEKILYQKKPKRFEYRLTEKGIELFPVLMSIVRWGDKWADEGNGPPIIYKHLSCGHKTHVEMSCSICGEPINPRDIQPLIGPGLKHHLQSNDDAQDIKAMTSYKYLKNNS